MPVAVRGTISFKISDYREFIELHRLNSFNLEDFQMQIRDAVSRYVKDIVANIPAAHNIPLIQIETKIFQINDVFEYDLSERFRESFGVELSVLFKLKNRLKLLLQENLRRIVWYGNRECKIGRPPGL